MTKEVAQTFDTKKILIHAVILFVVSFVLFLLLCPWLVMITSKLGALSHYGVKNIIITKYAATEDNTYIDAGLKIAVYKDKDLQQSMQLELFMQTRKHKGFEQFQLQKGEIALSKNVAQEYRLKAGDELYLVLGYSDIPQRYIIKTIFDSYYGIADVMDIRGIGIAGYDNDFETKLSIQYIIFSTFELDETPSHIILLLERIIMSSDVRQILYMWLLLYFVIIATVICVFQVITSNSLKEKHKPLLFQIYRYGLSYWKMVLFAIYLGCALIFAPMCSAYLLYVILFGHFMLTVWSVLFCLIVSFLLSFFWVAGTIHTCLKQVRFRK
jgi:hypothetical protein